MNEIYKKEDENRPSPLQIAVLISNKGTGSNLQAVIDAIGKNELNANISAVVSDKSDAKGIERAKKHDLLWIVKELKDRKSIESRNRYGEGLAIFLNDMRAQVAILAGFATILSPSYFEKFKGITINIHPGLIPDRKDEPWRFPDGTPAPWNQGLMTDKAVGDFIGMQYAGSTIHVVTQEPDFGPVLERIVIYTQPEDTIDSLYSRLKLEEHKGLIRALQNPRKIFQLAEHVKK
ncbi:MAG: formyltransferase family protein [bacterium]|nr:formyltransferase family protein [bacterium]